MKTEYEDFLDLMGSVMCSTTLRWATDGRRVHSSVGHKMSCSVEGGVVAVMPGVDVRSSVAKAIDIVGNDEERVRCIEIALRVGHVCPPLTVIRSKTAYAATFQLYESRSGTIDLTVWDPVSDVHDDLPASLTVASIFLAIVCSACRRGAGRVLYRVGELFLASDTETSEMVLSELESTPRGRYVSFGVRRDGIGSACDVDEEDVVVSACSSCRSECKGALARTGRSCA
jgi:hypothetical protein